MSVTTLNSATGFVPDPRALVGAVPLKGYEHHRHERSLADQAPVHVTKLPDGLEVYVTTMGLADTRVLLSGTGTWPRMSKDASALRSAMLSQGVQPGEIIGRNLLYSDLPEHQVLHGLVRSGFSRARIEGLRPRLHDLILDLLDALPEEGEPVDVVERIAVPLPLTMICELMGVPTELRPDMRRWSAAIMTNDPAVSAPAGQAMAEAFSALIALRRKRPDEALLSALVHADVDGARLGDEQLATMLILLIVAGHETTTALIGNCLAALLHSPGAWKSLAGQHTGIGSAIAEVIRWDSPVRMTPHYLATDTIHLSADHAIPEGAVIMVNLGTAGRCRRHNGSAADLFNPFRETNAGDHVGFGHGLHFCLGNLLATTEVDLLMRVLCDRYPNSTLVGDIRQTPRARSSITNAWARLDVQLRR
ncbi:cytochrome P450 [Saccharothrix sp.]|uniref:cytochrome P450 n=1 Tax=Saccharothrix sp. TaxID=1873460 RepID=UPI002811CECD|nr:cytochrome P450 [Saccharothrix sp.]